VRRASSRPVRVDYAGTIIEATVASWLADGHRQRGVRCVVTHLFAVHVAV
jgi:hypothetical protein